MPPSPELRNAFGNIWIVEVFREPEAQHMAHADCHIGIAGKIKINLEGKGQNSQPYHKDAALLGQNAIDFSPEGSGLIGKKHLFSQTNDKITDTQRELFQIFPSAV